MTNVLREIISDCKQIQTKNDENIILEVLRLSGTFFVCSSCLYMTVVIFFVITFAASYNTENRVLFLEAAFPFEVYKSPIFEIICLIQFFTTFFTGLGNAFFDGLFITMVSKLKV